LRTSAATWTPSAMNSGMAPAMVQLVVATPKKPARWLALATSSSPCKTATSASVPIDGPTTAAGRASLSAISTGTALEGVGGIPSTPHSSGTRMSSLGRPTSLTSAATRTAQEPGSSSTAQAITPASEALVEDLAGQHAGATNSSLCKTVTSASALTLWAPVRPTPRRVFSSATRWNSGQGAGGGMPCTQS